MKKYIGLFTALLFALTVSYGCAPKPRTQQGEMDTPEHHVYTGNKFYEKGETGKALEEYNLALGLNPKFSQAHAGLALVSASNKDFNDGYKHIEHAKSYAKNDEDKIWAHAAKIRVLTMDGTGDWLYRAEKEFENAKIVNSKSPAVHFYMAKAYKKGLEFNKAGDLLRKVLEFNDKYVMEANNEWEIVQKIQLASPGTIVGKRIAIVDEITKADVAGLFIEELNLEKLYQKRTPKTFDTSFKAPDSSYKADWVQKAVQAEDISSHPLKNDIETVMSLAVKGLEPGPDHKFYPNEKISKAEYALMLEDILIKITGDAKLATKFIGETSPFPDLRNDLPYFNAVMTMTSRGIMKAKDISTGEFGAKDSVSGADALLIIRKFKDELKF